MHVEGKNILVTGGAGFIGSHLVDRLIKKKSTVKVIDNYQAGRRENLNQSWDEIQVIKGDIRNSELVREVIEDVDVIFHIAANASVPYSVKNPRYDFETNALGTFNILEASINSNVEKIIYASSAAVYGEPTYTPIDEVHPLNPISPYGTTKLAGEKLGFTFKEIYGLDFTAIRIFNTYGPRQPRYVIYDFIKKLNKNPDKLEVLGSGEQVRDYCYISDMVNAFILVAEKGNSVYNAAGGSPISIRELADLMVSEISPNAKIKYGGKTWKGDINVLTANITRLKNLGFQPEIDFKTGIKRTIEWFKGVFENENPDSR